jgi:hypothetical protein
VVLVGPSKAGKTRTAFEVMRGHDDWGKAVLVVPKPQALDRLAGHPGHVACHSPMLKHQFHTPFSVLAPLTRSLLK